MVFFQKVEQAGNTWRLLDKDGNPIGRIWANAHIDRILRDGDFAEGVVAVLSQTGAARRTAARSLYNQWLAAGGRSVNFSALTHSLNNDAGVEDGNRHLYIAGNEFGYLHGVDPQRDSRLLRIVRLLEEVFSGEQLGTTALRNQALDAALDRFRDDGAIN